MLRLAREVAMSDDPTTPYKTPEPPDQDAVNEHREDAEGPFGADMTNLLGGTRAPQENAATPAQGTAYSTGTDAETGASVLGTDPRARSDRNGSGEGDGS